MDPLSIHGYFHEQLTGYPHQLFKHLNLKPLLRLAWVAFRKELRKTDIHNPAEFPFLPTHLDVDTWSSDSGVDTDFYNIHQQQ